MAAQCRSPRCTAERKGFRRELDSWRHRLIHCVGFESILEGLYGPGLRRDLSLFDDCEPEELVDWCADNKCSLCSIRKDSVGDCTQSVGSEQSTPTEELISQGQFSEETVDCQAEDYLNALFQKKDLPQNCDPNIPLVAQELLKKMIRQFAVEYISKSSKERHENDETAMERAPACCDSQEDQEGPLDLTVTRFQGHHFLEEEEVLDLSINRNNTLGSLKNRNSKTARWQNDRPDYLKRSAEFAEGLLSKALKDIQLGTLDINKAAVLYGIPQKTLILHLKALSAGKPAYFKNPAQNGYDGYLFKNNVETCEVLQKVALWAKAQAEHTEKNKLKLLETLELKLPTASSYLHQLTLQRMVAQFKEKKESLHSESSNPTVQLKIPQVRVNSIPKPQTDCTGLLDVMYQVTKASTGLEGSSLQKLKNVLHKQNRVECSKSRTHSNVDSYSLHGDSSPLCLNSKNGTGDASSDNLEDDKKDKHPRKKRGRYRQYDHEMMEEAIAMVMSGKMSASKAQGIYGVPHSTLEYKVKERSGTLKSPPKKKIRLADTDLYNVTNSGTDNSRNGSKPIVINFHNQLKSGKATKPPNGDTVLCDVLNSLCPYHKQQLTFLLRFLKEEQKVCSEVCFSKTNLYPGLKMSSRKENLPAVFYSFAKQRLTRRGRLKRKEPYHHLPYLSVCLKDIHLTCPGLASGTVKLDSFQNQNLRLEVSDRPLNDRNLCQKEQPCRPSEYFGHCSGTWDRSSFETHLTPQSLQFEGEMQVQDTLSQRALKDNCDQLPSLVHTTGEYRKRKLNCNAISMKQGKVAVNDQSKSDSDLQNLKDTFNGKFKETRICPKITNPLNLYNTERKRINGVKFGNLIKHFINNVKLNDSSFVEMLNLHKNSTETKMMQTRFQKRQEKLLSSLKSPGFALSRHRSLEIKSEIKSLIETFRKRMASHEKNKKKPARHTGEINNYIKGNTSFISESDYSINTQAVTTVREYVTHLPHTNRRIILKNDISTNSCNNVPDHLPHSAPQNHTDETKDYESRIETQENALKKSKPRNAATENSGNLFCKCTLNQISGMLTNIPSDYRNNKTANLPNNKAHLLVVVERLRECDHLHNILLGKSNAHQCQTRSTFNAQDGCELWSENPDTPALQKGLSLVPQIRLRRSKDTTITSFKNKDILNSNSLSDLAKNKQGRTGASKVHPLTGVSSPVKVMFVSKVNRNDGIHYTLSPEHQPYNKNVMGSPVSSRGDMMKTNSAASIFSQDYNKTRLADRPMQHTSSDKINSKEEWFVKRNPEGPNTIGSHSLKLVRRTSERHTNLQINLSKHFGKLSKYKTGNGLLGFKTKKSRIARRSIRIAQRILFMSHKVSATQRGDCNKPLSDGYMNISEPKQTFSSQSKVKTAEETCSDPSLPRNKKTNKSAPSFGHKLIIAKKDKKWQCRQSSQKPIKPKRKRNVRSSLLRTYQLCQQHAKLKKPVLHSLASLTSFSFRSALYHHSNRILSTRYKAHRRKLKNKNKPYNLQYNLGSITSTRLNSKNSVKNSTGFILEGASDIQSNGLLNRWSTSASNESLLKALDNRYENMASTWVHENKREERRKMEISGGTLQKPSPIQMLFQKKIDLNHISAWFMQTTETQSLSITRNPNACNSSKYKQKGKKFKLSKVHENKETRKCAHLAVSDTSKEKQHIDNLCQTEHFCTRNVKYVKHGVLQQKDSSHGKKKLSGGDKCHNIWLKKLDASSRKLNLVDTVLHGNIPLLKTLLGANSKGKKSDNLLKNNQTKKMKTYKSLKIKDIRICLKRLSNEVPNKNVSLELVQFTNASEVNKRTLRSNSCLKSNIQSLQMNHVQAKSLNTTPEGIQFPKKQVCLRNSRREVLFAPLSKRKRSEQAFVHMENGIKKRKTQYSVHEQNDYSNIQLVPLKPVGLKSFRGLSSKDGSFSLTPIRIPFHGSRK